MTKELTAHNDGKVGGVLVGNSHAEGGIKAFNKSTGQPIEVEGNEIIINKKSVEDPTLHDLNGEKLTNKQILSKINSQDGNGVSFAEGGEMHSCGCSGHKHKYNGRDLTDYEIVSEMARGGNIQEVHPIEQLNEMHARYNSFAKGGPFSESIEPEISDFENKLLYTLRYGSKKVITISKEAAEKAKGLVENGLAHITTAGKNFEMYLTRQGEKFISGNSFEKGGPVNGEDIDDMVLAIKKKYLHA